MSTRAGWTFNGHHYTECESTRMGRPLFSYHRDGVRMSRREWSRAMEQDRAADKEARVETEPPAREAV